jgi:hypothetical protein
VLFLSVPDKRYTFDKYRSVTSLEHLIRDHCDGPKVSREDHFRDYFDKRNYDLPDFEEFIADTPAKSGYVHCHIWTGKEIVDLLSCIEEEWRLGFSILKVVNTRFENIFIVKKL